MRYTAFNFSGEDKVMQIKISAYVPKLLPIVVDAINLFTIWSIGFVAACRI